MLDTIKSPKISVIIPNYNHAAYLKKRFLSVLNQTYQDFEIIYLDDASTDNSTEVFAEFENDSRVRAVFNQENSGSPFKQWNRGVALAKGEYIWIAEADDYSDQKFLEVLVEKLEACPKVGIAYCQSWQVDENDTIINSVVDWTIDLDKTHWQADYVNSGKDECRDYLVHKNTILNASAVLFRRDVFEKSGMAIETLKITGDWLTWVNMLLISDIAFVSTPLNYFRRHGQSVRDKTLWDGTLIREHYSVLRQMKKNIQIPERVLAERLDSIMNELVKIITAKNNAIKLSGLYGIYKIAKRDDSQVVLRFVKIISRFIFQKLIGKNTKPKNE